MPTTTGDKEKHVSILESFKIMFSTKNLGKEAAIEHIENNSSKKKS